MHRPTPLARMTTLLICSLFDDNITWFAVENGYAGKHSLNGLRSKCFKKRNFCNRSRNTAGPMIERVFIHVFFYWRFEANQSLALICYHMKSAILTQNLLKNVG